MSNLLQRYKQIEQLVTATFAPKADEFGNHEAYPNKPKLTDNQVVTLSIFCYVEDIHSELNLYRHLQINAPSIFRMLPDRSNFNKRRRRLQYLVDEVQASIVDLINFHEDTYVVDSMPLPICRYARANRCKILKDDDVLQPSYGYKHIDKQHYFGLKLHLAITANGLITKYLLSEAAVHDVSMVSHLAHGLLEKSKILADKGYISKSIQTSLFDVQQITLITPNRANMAPNKQWTKSKARARRRIETTFSQLVDQFRITINYAKKMEGYITRLTSRIAAFTCLQYFNVKHHRALNHLKDALHCL